MQCIYQLRVITDKANCILTTVVQKTLTSPE